MEVVPYRRNPMLVPFPRPTPQSAPPLTPDAGDRVVAFGRAGGRTAAQAVPTVAVAPAILRVVVGHGAPLGRAGLRAMLESHPSVGVAAMAASGEQVVAEAASTGCDVVVLDAAIPGLDSLEATHRITGADPSAATKVILVVGAATDQFVLQALRAGASGLLDAEAAAGDVVAAARAVAAGGASLMPGVARRLVDELVARPAALDVPVELFAELTLREREVTALVACGLSNQEIAGQLVISPATAKTHVSRAMLKLHARDRTQLAVFAYQAGLVRAGGAHAAAVSDRIAGRTPRDVALAARWSA
jgi:DNA-binding NarL/FixJ family response regulator